MAAKKKKPTKAERKKRVAAAAASAGRYKESRSRTGTKAKAERQYVPTGSLELDLRLGGGWVRGRMYELYGPEAVGKTTLALIGVAQAQALGGIGAIVDVEGAIDMDYAETLGVELDSVLVMSPDTAEDALNAVRGWIRQGVDIIVIDSVAALAPRAEKDGEIGDAHVGRQSRLMSQTMRCIASDVQRFGSVVIWINQIREKVGILFGNPETTPGGRALKHYASGRIETRAGTKIAALKKKTKRKKKKAKPTKKKGARKRKSEAAPIGRWVKLHIVKNKTAAPFQRVEFPLIFGQGIDVALEAWRLAEEMGLFFKSGSWVYWNGTSQPTTSKANYFHKWNGEADFREALRADGLRANVLAAVRDGLREASDHGPGGEGGPGHDDEGPAGDVQPASGEAAGEEGADGDPDA